MSFNFSTENGWANWQFAWFSRKTAPRSSEVGHEETNIEDTIDDAVFDPHRRYIMTRRLFYLRDKLSRQYLMPGLAEFQSTCRIRDLAERERLAPILRRQLASLIDATRYGSKDFKLFPLIEVGLLVRTTPNSGGLFLGLQLIGADHQSNTDSHPSFLATVSLGDLSLIGAVDVLQTRPEEHRLF